jgi:uncharacterized protein YqjF (DUF2071 family)
MTLDDTIHRPYPLPPRPWTVFMQWLDLAFLHWPVPADQLRRLLPAGIELDTFDNTAWIGIVPFRMAGIRHRLFAPVPGLSAFHELNVRTYVKCNGKPGVWFFSLDAANPLAVFGARRTFHLRYYHARMHSSASSDGAIAYESVRTHRGEPPARFVGGYRAAGDVFRTVPGSLEHFLTERYCLYAVDPTGQILRGDIHHGPWPLQRGEADLSVNMMTHPLGIALPDEPPLVHVAHRIDAVAWTLVPA